MYRVRAILTKCRCAVGGVSGSRWMIISLTPPPNKCCLAAVMRLESRYLPGTSCRLRCRHVMLMDEGAGASREPTRPRHSVTCPANGRQGAKTHWTTGVRFKLNSIPSPIHGSIPFHSPFFYTFSSYIFISYTFFFYIFFFSYLRGKKEWIFARIPPSLSHVVAQYIP